MVMCTKFRNILNSKPPKLADYSQRLCLEARSKYFSLSHIIIEENEILVGENESRGSVFSTKVIHKTIQRTL